MKVNWLRISMIGAVITTASILLVFAITRQIEKSALERVNEEQAAQFTHMLQVQQNVAQDLQDLKLQSDMLRSKQVAINTTANAGLAQIKKLREESARNYEEIHALPPDAVNRIIMDGLAKYKAAHGR